MADLERGATSARVDLNLNLAPPWDPNIIGVNLPLREESFLDESLRHLPRNSLPIFGPGIHGLYLDLHHENEMQPGQSVLAEARGLSPSLSSMSHEQVIHPSVHEQTSGLFQETVEQLLEQAREQSQIRRNIFDISRDNQTSRPLPPELPLRFRRYSHPLQVAAETIENISNQSVLLDRLVDVIKEDTPKDESSDSGKGGERNNAGNYECNVCLEMAVEPVLTFCGHLFCWPCLYQWLYVHSENDECPVCKGAVTERDIIPIYGRGSASFSARNSSLERVDFVPRRPHARRTESFRQRLGRREFPAEEERENVRNYMWRFNEALRLRSFHFPPEVMSERREHTRAPRVEYLPRPEDEATHTFRALQQQTVGNVQEEFHRRVEFLSDHFQEDLIRRLAMNTSEIEDRLAVIRARLTNLSGEVSLHRTISAALSVSGILIPSVTEIHSPRQILPDVTGISMLEEIAPSQVIEINRRENQETSDVVFGSQRLGIVMAERNEAPDPIASECADVDVESSHGRKRIRLN